MINTMKPGGGQGHGESRGEILEKIQNQYGRPEEKQREANKKLGKDEFFKIMVTQIQHQDPLKPYQNEQMAAQMAQFSALEQMMNVNTNLEKLAQSQAPMQQLTAAGLIGKHVTVDSSRVMHTEGKQSDLKFQLPLDAANVRINILNEKGESVRELEAKNLKKGEATVNWDGKRSNNFPAATGTYMLQISAESEQGKNIPVTTQNVSVVHGIGFEGKETVLLTGDVRSPQKLLLRNVTKIIDPAQKNAAGASAAAQTPGFIPFPGAEALGQLQPQPQPQTGADGSTAQDEDLIPDEKPMQGYDPNASKYTPISLPGMRAAQQKPTVLPQVTNDDIREALARAQDLTDANPVAASIRTGEPLAPAQASAPQMAPQTNSSPGNPLPSSADGSTAGKWSE